MSSIVHGGKYSEGRPLKVLIAGAGIGGLSAALCLREQGHEVTLFERSELASELGAALHLAPNCNGILRRVGLYAEKIGANPMDGLAEYDANGKFRGKFDLRGPNTMWQHPWLLVHRIHLHEELKRLATTTEGKGTPAVLKTASRVVSVDPETATVTLENGETVQGDMVIGADGVGSACRKVIYPEAKIYGSGKSAFRFLISKDKLLANPLTKKYFEGDGVLTFWIASDRRFVSYPCANNTIMNFVAIHPTDLSDTNGDDWNQESSQEAMLSVYKDFDEPTKAIIKMADPATVKVWPLLDMKELPRWSKGRLTLLGDAAHPFLPHQGQGGGVAIEDAGSLGAIFPLGTPVEEIPERLKLYEQTRMERAETIREYTRMAGRDLLTSEEQEKFNMQEFSNYNFGHDEWHNSVHALKKWLWTRQPKVYYRQPVGFGPMTSPRQDHYGRKIPSTESVYTAHTIKVKTSRTYLQTLFPNDQFSFVSPATYAEATFKTVTLDKLGWLGGKGYNFFGLWIHGVQYTKKDGSKLFGSYLPVLFESLHDPITTGREELGMPKLWCDIDVYRRPKSSTIKASWRGATFAELEFEDLLETDIPTGADGFSGGAKSSNSNGATNGDLPPWQQTPRDDGELIYRYIPAVGKPGTAEAEYAVFVPKAGRTTPGIPKRAFKAKGAKITLNARDWDSLPTLHHVAAGLAEVPIYEILEARIDEGQGVEDLSQAHRIE